MAKVKEAGSNARFLQSVIEDMCSKYNSSVPAPPPVSAADEPGTPNNEAENDAASVIQQTEDALKHNAEISRAAAEAGSRAAAAATARMRADVTEVETPEDWRKFTAPMEDRPE